MKNSQKLIPIKKNSNLKQITPKINNLINPRMKNLLKKTQLKKIQIKNLTPNSKACPNNKPPSKNYISKSDFFLIQEFIFFSKKTYKNKFINFSILKYIFF
jgi:hypothetical protein